MKTAKKKFKHRAKQFKKHAKRLAAYSATAAATVLTTGDSTVNAAEVVHDILDVSIDAGTNGGYGIAFNIQTKATYYPAGAVSTPGYFNYNEGNFRVSPSYRGYIIGPAYTTAPNSFFGLGFLGMADPNAPSYAHAFPIAAGNEISNAFVYQYADPNKGTTTLGMNVGPGYSQNYFAALSFYDNQTAFVGLRFTLNAGATTHFGWAQITRGANSNQYILHGFGYNDVHLEPSLPTDTTELFGDLDGDGDIDLNDWADLRDNSGADLSNGGTQAELFAAYAQGDLDRNGTNDVFDFGLFREAYETENGVGSFAAMLAASAVPEPSSILLLAAGAAGLGMWRKKRAE
jgi:hypothetical protein